MTLQPHTAATHKGRRPYQEDRFFSLSHPKGFAMGVFDGHGGHQVSHMASELAPKLLTAALEGDKPIPDVLKNVFEKLNLATAGLYEGSSASIVFITADTVHVAVLGDSPVIVRTADGTIWHGPDHNVRSNEAEAEAARGRGGFIHDGYLCETYNGPGLQMARALGDVELRRVLLRTPEIASVPLGEGSWVLVASDGALDPGHWDAHESAQKVVELIQSGSDAQAIVDRAVAIPTGDNVTALIVRVENAADVPVQG